MMNNLTARAGAIWITRRLFLSSKSWQRGNKNAFRLIDSVERRDLILHRITSTYGIPVAHDCLTLKLAVSIVPSMEKAFRLFDREMST